MGAALAAAVAEPRAQGQRLHGRERQCFDGDSDNDGCGSLVIGATGKGGKRS